jgi:hypothetical protein
VGEHERDRYRRVCRNKVKHRTWALAAKEARRLNAKDGAMMGAYCCPFCGGWHVGHIYVKR